MKEWFDTLTQREQKDLVCMLFEVRSKLREHRHYRLFAELVRWLDDRYHAQKATARR